MHRCQMIPPGVVSNTLGNTPMRPPLGNFRGLFPVFLISLLKNMKKEKKGKWACVSAYTRVKAEAPFGNMNWKHGVNA